MNLILSVLVVVLGVLFLVVPELRENRKYRRTTEELRTRRRRLEATEWLEARNAPRESTVE